MASDGVSRTAVVTWGAILGWALMALMERALGLIFVLNFTVEGLGPSVLWTLGLLTGGGLWLGRALPGDARRHTGLAVVLAVAWVGTLVPMADAALALAVVGHLAGTLLLGRTTAALGPSMAWAVAAGLALRIAVRGATGGLHLYATDAGAVALVAGALALLVAFWQARPGLMAAVGPSRGMASVWVTLLAGVLWTATPAAFGRWHGLPGAAFWQVAGLGAGALVLLRAHSAHQVLAAALLVAGAAWSVGGPLLPGLGLLLLVPASLWLLAGAAHGGPGPTRLLGAQVVALLLVFLLVVAANWSFVAGVGPLVHGQAGWLLAAVLVLPLVAAWQRPVQVRPRPTPAPMVAAATVAVVFALVPVLFAAAPAEDPHPDDLRVATWNVHQYYDGWLEGEFAVDEILAQLQALDADLIALQESDGSRVTSGGVDGVPWLARQTGMHAAQGPPAKDMTYGVALLSRWPIQDVDVVHLPSDTTHGRVALVATVQTPGGPLTVAVPHLEIEEHAEVRLAQAEALVAAIPPGPAIVLGDLNTPTDVQDPAYQTLAAAWNDAWTAGGHAIGTGATSPLPGPPEVRIDHIWLQGAWEVQDIATFGSTHASDHLGVVADVRLPDG